MEMQTQSTNDKNKVFIEFCKSCDSHNWCTHHDQQKYKQAYIDLSKILQQQLPGLLIYGNEIPTDLIPIKAKQNKYFHSREKKYVMFPAIGAFEVHLNQELIFSKRNTNSWPNLQEITNTIFQKIIGNKRKITQDSLGNYTQKKIKSEKIQKQTVATADNMLRNFDQNSFIQTRTHKKQFTLTDHFKRYKMKKKMDDDMGSLYAQSQSGKYGRISKITPEDIKKLHQIWGKKQNLPNFIKLKAFIQQKQGRKQMLVNLSSIQQQSQLKQNHIVVPSTKKNKSPNHLQLAFQKLQNKFLNFQNRVSEVNSKKNQFQTFHNQIFQSKDNKRKEGVKKQKYLQLSRFNIQNKIKQVKTAYNAQKILKQIKGKKRKIQQYLHANSEEKNQKLEMIYGPQLLKQNISRQTSKRQKKQKVNKITKYNQNNQNEDSSQKMSQSQDSNTDIFGHPHRTDTNSFHSNIQNQFNFPQNIYTKEKKRNIFTREKLSSSPKDLSGKNYQRYFQKQKRAYQSRSVLHKALNSRAKIKISKQSNRNSQLQAQIKQENKMRQSRKGNLNGNGQQQKNIHLDQRPQGNKNKQQLNKLFTNSKMIDKFDKSKMTIKKSRKRGLRKSVQINNTQQKKTNSSYQKIKKQRNNFKTNQSYADQKNLRCDKLFQYNKNIENNVNNNLQNQSQNQSQISQSYHNQLIKVKQNVDRKNIQMKSVKKNTNSKPKNSKNAEIINQQERQDKIISLNSNKIKNNDSQITIRKQKIDYVKHKKDKSIKKQINKQNTIVSKIESDRFKQNKITDQEQSNKNQKSGKIKQRKKNQLKDSDRKKQNSQKSDKVCNNEKYSQALQFDSQKGYTASEEQQRKDQENNEYRQQLKQVANDKKRNRNTKQNKNNEKMESQYSQFIKIKDKGDKNIQCADGDQEGLINQDSQQDIKIYQQSDGTKDRREQNDLREEGDDEKKNQNIIIKIHKPHDDMSSQNQEEMSRELGFKKQQEQEQKKKQTQLNQENAIQHLNNVGTSAKPRRIYDIHQQLPDMVNVGTQTSAHRVAKLVQTVDQSEDKIDDKYTQNIQQLQQNKSQTQTTLNRTNPNQNQIVQQNQTQNNNLIKQKQERKQSQKYELTDTKYEKTCIGNKNKTNQNEQIQHAINNNHRKCIQRNMNQGHHANKNVEIQQYRKADITRQLYGKQYLQYTELTKQQIIEGAKSAKLRSGELGYKQMKLFDLDRINYEQVVDRSGKLENLCKIINVICSKNQYLLIRLFSNPHLSHAPSYSVWLCHNYTWKCFIVDSPTSADIEAHALYMQDDNPQLWPIVLVQSFIELYGTFQKLTEISVSQLFHNLTGSNFLNFQIKEDPDKNAKLLKFVSNNEKKNFIILAQKRMYKSLGQSLQQKNKRSIFYILSQKTINKNEVLLRMKKGNEDDAFWIKLQKFVAQFCSVSVLQLRVNHNFLQLSICENSQDHYQVIQLAFQQQCFGCIAFISQKQTDFKVYLYKEQQDNILRLVGQIKQRNKKMTFFDCCFDQGKYFIFADSKGTKTKVCYIGEGQPQIRVKQQIKQIGLKNNYTQYVPVNNPTYKPLQEMPQFLDMAKKTDKESIFGVSSVAKSQQTKKIDKEKLKTQFIDYLMRN